MKPLVAVLLVSSLANASEKALTYEEQILYDLRFICASQNTIELCYETKTQIQDILDCGNDIHMRRTSLRGGTMLLRMVSGDPVILSYGSRRYFVQDLVFTADAMRVYPQTDRFEGFADGAEDCINYVFDDNQH